jgi:hypothetical protein
MVEGLVDGSAEQHGGVMGVVYYLASDKKELFCLGKGPWSRMTCCPWGKKEGLQTTVLMTGKPLSHEAAVAMVTDLFVALWDDYALREPGYSEQWRPHLGGLAERVVVFCERANWCVWMVHDVGDEYYELKDAGWRLVDSRYEHDRRKPGLEPLA